MRAGAYICESVFCASVRMCANVCARGCRQRWERVLSWPRADPGNTIHQGEMDGEMGEVRGRERDERKKRDPRRGVTLPNHQDGGKARSDSQGSSDSSKLHLCCSHQPWPP